MDVVLSCLGERCFVVVVDMNAYSDLGKCRLLIDIRARIYRHSPSLWFSILLAFVLQCHFLWILAFA